MMAFPLTIMAPLIDESGQPARVWVPALNDWRECRLPMFVWNGSAWVRTL